MRRKGIHNGTAMPPAGPSKAIVGCHRVQDQKRRPKLSGPIHCPGPPCDGPPNMSTKAPFETAADYYIEITSRLERCGTDGLILEALESWGKSPSSLTSYFGMPEWSIRKRRKSALGYVASGPARRWHNTKKRKAEEYKDFKRRKK